MATTRDRNARGAAPGTISKNLIAAVQTTLGGRILDGESEWVDPWADP